MSTRYYAQEGYQRDGLFAYVPAVYTRPHTQISYGIQAPIGDRGSQPFIHSVGSDFEDEQTET